MEAVAAFTFIGAMIGAGVGFLWMGIDLVSGTQTMTADTFSGCVLIGSVLTPVLGFAAIICGELSDR